jgi:hypothetical protein
MNANGWRTVAIAEAVVILAGGIAVGVVLSRSARPTATVATSPAPSPSTTVTTSPAPRTGRHRGTDRAEKPSLGAVGWCHVRRLRRARRRNEDPRGSLSRGRAHARIRPRARGRQSSTLSPRPCGGIRKGAARCRSPSRASRRPKRSARPSDSSSRTATHISGARWAGPPPTRCSAAAMRRSGPAPAPESMSSIGCSCRHAESDGEWLEVRVEFRRALACPCGVVFER